MDGKAISVLSTLVALGLAFPVASRAETFRISNQAQYEALRKTRFKAGDTILFERGRTFTGQFRPLGDGTPGRPIIVDAYGQGALPELTGNVIGERDSSGIVTLVNQQGWEFHHLSISNGTPGPEVSYPFGL